MEASRNDRDRPLTMTSPFLNFDPALINANPNEQFIFAEGQAGRGRFERSLSGIGSCVLGGVTIGGTRGLYLGLTDAQRQSLGSSALRRSHLINNVVRSGGSLAQTAGSIGLFYGLFEFALGKIRDEDDNINTMSAAILTGLTYKSPSLFAASSSSAAAAIGGIKPNYFAFIRGGLVGAAVGAALVAASSADTTAHFLG